MLLACAFAAGKAWRRSEMDFLWWVERFELPALGFLGAWNLRLQSALAKTATVEHVEERARASEMELGEMRKHQDVQMNLMREDMSSSKVAALREFASAARMSDIEDKIDRRFDRLEKKLDDFMARRSH